MLESLHPYPGLQRRTSHQRQKCDNLLSYQIGFCGKRRARSVNVKRVDVTGNGIFSTLLRKARFSSQNISSPDSTTRCANALSARSALQAGVFPCDELCQKSRNRFIGVARNTASTATAAMTGMSCQNRAMSRGAATYNKSAISPTSDTLYKPVGHGRSGSHSAIYVPIKDRTPPHSHPMSQNRQ